MFKMEEAREVQQEEADVEIVENDEVEENEAAVRATHEDRRQRKIERKKQIWEKIRKTAEANKRATAIMAVQIEKDLLEFKRKIAEAKPNDSKTQEEKRGAIKWSSKNTTKTQNGRNKTLPQKSREESIKTLSANDLNGARQLERILISIKLENRMLHPYEVTADNNSLYTAICNQLEMMNNQVMTVEELRRKTSEYIKKNKNEFASSMINDSSVILSERDLDIFCDQIRLGLESVTHLELKAIVHVIKNPICIIQAIGPDEIYETSESNGPPLIIIRYEHLYKNNCDDHYDSTLLIEGRFPYEMDNVTPETETY